MAFTVTASDGAKVSYLGTYKYALIEGGTIPAADAGSDMDGVNNVTNATLYDLVLLIDYKEDYHKADPDVGELAGWHIDVWIKGAQIGGLVLSLDSLKVMLTNTVDLPNPAFDKEPDELIYEIESRISESLESDADNYGPPSDRFAA